MKCTTTFTSCGTTPAPCTNPNRASGQVLYVQMSYDVSNILFLQSTFKFGSLQTSIPTSLPAYKVSVMVE